MKHKLTDLVPKWQCAALSILWKIEDKVTNKLIEHAWKKLKKEEEENDKFYTKEA